MNCNGCGVDLEPTTEELNRAVDQILDTSLKDAVQTGGVCPLCGHSKEIPYSQRKSVQFILLLAVLVVALGTAAAFYWLHQTARQKVANEVLTRLNENSQIKQWLGTPLTLKIGISGKVVQDETGWTETTLTIPVHGPNGDGLVHVAGGKASGPWVFSELEVIAEAQRKKIDIISGRVVEYDPAAYVDTHTQAAAPPEYVMASVAAPTLPDSHPCMYAAPGNGWAPQFGRCQMALPMAATGPVDRFEIDLRYGSFIVRQTDLFLKDVMNVPLTRTYASGDWVHPNRTHAFGKNSSHPFDVAPLGTRNPYTYQLLALEDSDLIFFDRVSKGTGYADSVYLHTETSSSFYKATQRWNGHGWTMKLADGSTILFPESYNAKNLAQGAALVMADKDGNKIELERNGKRDLQTIKAPHGATIQFIYDDQSRITKALDSSGNWASYQYDSAGMLSDMTSSAGIQRHYKYDGLKMISIQDESGKVLVRNSYYNGWLNRQETDAGVYQYDYESNPPYSHATRVKITMPDGSIKTVELSDSVPKLVARPPQQN